MHDFTNEEGLMTLKMSAPGLQRKTQTYNVESFKNRDGKEDSGESMYVNAIPTYTLPIVEGKPPEDEEYTNLSVSLKLFVLPLLAANFICFTGVGSNSRRSLKSTLGWRAIVVLHGFAWHRMRSLHHRYLPPIFTPTSTVHGRLNVPRDLQWESDYDRSRFVTNAVYDLIPGNVIFLPSSFVAKMCLGIPMEWKTSEVDAISGRKKSVHEPTAWGKSTDGLLAGGSTKNYRFYSGPRQLDDMFAAGDPDRMVQERLSQTSPYALEVKVKLTERIDPTCITGVQIERVRGKSGWTKLQQTKYMTNFLKGHKTGSARPVDTPMDPGLARVLMEFPQDDFIKDFIKAFQIIVGVFSGRRTHVQFNLDIVVNSAPPFEILRCAEKHVDVVKGLFLRCLNVIDTRSHAVVFLLGKNNRVLTGYLIADLTGDSNNARSSLSTRRSELGGVGGSTDSLEAETMSHDNDRLCREGSMLFDMGFLQMRPSKIRIDINRVNSLQHYAF